MEVKIRRTATAALALAALALGVPAGAQDNDLDREEARIPEEAWATRFEGLWAEDGDCADSDKVWALAPDTLEMGRVYCAGLGKMTWSEDGLVVPVSQCRKNEAEAPDRIVTLRLGGEDEMLAYVGDVAEVEPARLERCVDPDEIETPEVDGMPEDGKTSGEEG